MNVWGLCVVIVVALGFSVEAQVNSTCNSNDSMVLKAFINGLESAIDGWTSKSSDCCDWAGVTCDFNGKVIGLELSKTKLMGYMDVSFTNLDQLKTLNLSDNLLKGTLPTSVFHLPYLELLDLSKNEFSGSLPASVNLPSIKLLDISDNNFKGPIAPGFCINSTEIRVLKLGENYFNGEIPQEFENCRFLEHLSLDANNITGIIPEYLFNLPRLSCLYLQDNYLIGQLHNSNPSNLVYLDVSINTLSGNLPDFSTFPNLTYFAASSNNLSGDLPPSLLNSLSISTLILRNNSFSGSIDLNCSVMINLLWLDLSYNYFLGTIPDNLPSCPKLTTVILGANNISGEFPESFKSFRSLSHFSLWVGKLKNLSNTLEILQHCPNLTTLVLTRSFNNEEIPYNANLQFKMLQTLYLRNCKLTGKIPLWFKGLTKLKILNLSGNQLSGEIPHFLGDLSSLVYFNASNNLLSGTIPKSLTRLPGLRFLDISVQVSVDLPLFNRRGMSGKAIPKYYGVPLQPTIDLSNNSLTGPLSEEFGNLKNLRVLNLTYNKLSGNIPSNFSELSMLVTLDLSHNNLNEHIPHSLVRLSFLSKFSVAYNNLTGNIPSEGQFSTFSSSSFEGNPGLCGDYFFKCEKVPKTRESDGDEDEDFFICLPLWIGFGIGFFFAVIFWLVLLPRHTDRL